MVGDAVLQAGVQCTHDVNHLLGKRVDYDAVLQYVGQAYRPGAIRVTCGEGAVAHAHAFLSVDDHGVVYAVDDLDPPVALGVDNRRVRRDLVVPACLLYTSPSPRD